METLRVYRPRVVLHGSPGMGQAYIGAAALHHLEGYHIQTLDLGSLMGDSTRVCHTFLFKYFSKLFLCRLLSPELFSSLLKLNGINLLLSIYPLSLAGVQQSRRPHEQP